MDKVMEQIVLKIHCLEFSIIFWNDHKLKALLNRDCLCIFVHQRVKMGLKILHTADWHLGKRLDSISRMEEQLNVLNEICEIADSENVDLVLIAGDLFDTFNPPVEAVELFYKVLKRLAKNGKRPVIAIAGNHDSPDRIDATDPLAKACGILLIGHPNAIVQSFELEDGFIIVQSDEGFVELQIPHIEFPIRIIHTPYANEIRLKQFLGTEDKGTALHENLKEKWESIATKYCDDKGVNLLISHLFMMQRNGELLEEPDGEKAIKVGNADVIYSDAIPTQIQYTALGHLHRYHQIGIVNHPVVYSGSPLCYSFSEAGQEKYVMLVEVQPNITASYRTIPLQAGRALCKKTFDDVEKAITWLQENPYTLVELTLISDTFLATDDLKNIRNAHDGIVYIIPKIHVNGSENIDSVSVNLDQDIQALFVDYFKYKHQQEPNEELLDLFDELMNQ